MFETNEALRAQGSLPLPCCRTVQLALTQTLSARPCCRRSDKDSDEEDADDAAPRKPVPEWARGRALAAQLATQAAVDPDEIFQQRQKTCPLDEVFGHAGAP